MPDLPSHAGASGASAAKPRSRALLVDDAEPIRLVLRNVLEQASIAVIEAPDGPRALEMLRADPSIGVVFLDVAMPGMGGLEVLAAIRAVPDLAEVPVVLLTGSFPGAAQAARELGAAGCLQKPIRMEALIKIARSFLPAP
ncbi:MAG: response regulator [Myxococcales bacterium]